MKIVKVLIFSILRFCCFLECKKCNCVGYQRFTLSLTKIFFAFLKKSNFFALYTL